MNIFLFLIGILLVAAAGRLALRAALVPRFALKAHLGAIRDYGFEKPSEERDPSTGQRLKRAFRQRAERTGRFMMRRFPSLPALSTSELSAAGFYDASAELVHGYRAFASLGLPLVLVLLMAPGGLSAFKLLLLFVFALAGWTLPSFLVRKRGAARLEEIDHRLPELIDILIATVEAGVGFTAALSLVAVRFDGAMGEELKLTMRQQSLGMSVSAALDEMVGRCDTASVRAFVRTASRGETLGASIGPILRELSADERRRHRMAAREKMQKAPIKMLFPTMFLIMPALMIVLMFPAVYNVMHSNTGLF
jgi:Flp pilus assembly protein TadB